jgi:hypothetical protein
MKLNRCPSCNAAVEQGQLQCDYGVLLTIELEAVKP